MLLAEQKIQQQEVQNYVELFEIVEQEALDGTMFQAKKSIGSYSKSDLEHQKEEMNRQIALIDEKIAAIDAII